MTCQDDFVIPAEVSMGLVGLYGLYFLAISWDLSNRKRKKRSLFHHQGSQILFSKKKSCNSIFAFCLQDSLEIKTKMKYLMLANRNLSPV